jgi:predicted small metal-binding protein
MSKRQRHRGNISKHIKSSHKKTTINRKIANTKVDKVAKNINQIISK